MTVNHKDLTGVALHEPKGVAAASANTVYVANGSGSGTWQQVASTQINTSSVKNLNKNYITYTIPDISTAGSHFIVTPIAGDIAKIYTSINNAITSVDCILTFEIGGTLVTNGAITIAYSGSAAGTVDNSTPSGANTLTAGQAIEIITNGASSTSCRATVTFELDVS
jgi:hypothetical protein|tara:strand:- start:803 stop:1303 length:501 start_codon:yes stop_codon:yes gene_type:complete